MTWDWQSNSRILNAVLKCWKSIYATVWWRSKQRTKTFTLSTTSMECTSMLSFTKSHFRSNVSLLFIYVSIQKFEIWKKRFVFVKDALFPTNRVFALIWSRSPKTPSTMIARLVLEDERIIVERKKLESYAMCSRYRQNIIVLYTGIQDTGYRQNHNENICISNWLYTTTTMTEHWTLNHRTAISTKGTHGTIAAQRWRHLRAEAWKCTHTHTHKTER